MLSNDIIYYGWLYSRIHTGGATGVHFQTAVLISLAGIMYIGEVAGVHIQANLAGILVGEAAGVHIHANLAVEQAGVHIQVD